MYDKHLDSFIAIAQSGSFSSAAEKRFISRTALIQQMNLLERKLKFQLFDRHHKGVTLTPAGKLFYEEAIKFMQSFQKLLHRCQEIDNKSKETVRIGTLPNFTAVLLPKICHAFAQKYPNIELQFMEFPLEQYYPSFTNNRFDITTEYMPGYVFEKPDYRFVKLMEDKHCCGVPKRHPLSAKQKLSLKDLCGQKIMLYARGIARADDQLRDYISENVADVEFVDIRQYSSSLSLKCELEGLILIYYSMYWKSFSNLCALPLEIDFPITIGLGYKSESNRAVKQFISLAEEMFNTKTGLCAAPF